ncbi:phage protein NinX family protein [Morganella morganii]|uniref:phage protein NinX family protein n=1 Tax=Morganella morganii TaxID=582 RepID=UPI000E65EAC3|nr:phage protein NinX family protein [Morganella morganii]
MNKYRDKSDFEINKAVADFYLTREYRFNSADKIVELMDIDLSCEFGGEINLKDKYVTGTFDPCNNPADAMPIIIENGISMIKSSGGWMCCHGAAGVIEHEKLYRAAMELFLMMNGAENEK